MTLPKGFPDMAPGQFVVVQVDARTGIVLNASGRYAAGDAYYAIFPSREEAAAYGAERLAAAPDTEWRVFDHVAAPVASFLNTDYWKNQVSNETARRDDGVFARFSRWLRRKQ